jgi:hypothetical protein
LQHTPRNQSRAGRPDTPRRSRYYDGPVSDHFDGVRFFDPAGAPPRSRGGLLRWMIARRFRRRRIPIVRPRGSRAQHGASPMSVMRAGWCRPPA